MTVVVTGSAGFVGRITVQALLDMGRPVVGIDRRTVPEPVAVAHQAGDFTALRGDLVDDHPTVRHALATADAVIHLAGCPGVRDDRPDVAQRRHRDNVLATAAVLGIVPAATPVVVASSSSVYGGSVAGRPCAETDPLQPRGGYAESKRQAELLCRERLRTGGVVAFARMFTVAGEGQRPDMALARWIADARAGRPLHIYGSLERTRDITDVRDAARALVGLADGRACGPMNIGTGVGRPLRELVRATAEVLGVDVVTTVTRAHPDEVVDTLADTRQLRAAVGFVPTTDLTNLVRRQVEADERRLRTRHPLVAAR